MNTLNTLDNEIFFASGPQGEFITGSAEMANLIIESVPGWDRDDWTVTNIGSGTIVDPYV
jgi:hypothetical protein